jgi:uncharacterized protein
MTDPGYPTPDPSTPPAGGVPPQQPYPQVPFTPPPPPPGYADSEEKTWALVAHFGGAAGAFFCGILSFVGPLVAYLAKGNSPTVKQHAANAFNFQVIISAICIVLYVIRIAAFTSVTTTGFAFGSLLTLVTWVVAIVGVVFGVIAGIQANNGQIYKYPVSVGILK